MWAWRWSAPPVSRVTTPDDPRSIYQFIYLHSYLSDPHNLLPLFHQHSVAARYGVALRVPRIHNMMRIWASMWVIWSIFAFLLYVCIWKFQTWVKNSLGLSLFSWPGAPSSPLRFVSSQAAIIRKKVSPHWKGWSAWELQRKRYKITGDRYHRRGSSSPQSRWEALFMYEAYAHM